MIDDNDSEILKVREEETIERAKLLYDYQLGQYELAVTSIRRLEDKATKIFGVLSVIITAVLLIIRYWWDDLFKVGHTPLQCICWGALFAVISFSLMAWGFTFSAMQTNDFEKPPSTNVLIDFFLNKKRYESMTLTSKMYSRLTDEVDVFHARKASLINNCSECMLFGAWSFVIFMVSFFIFKING